MGLFGFGSKKKDVVDLAERFKKQKEKEAQQSASSAYTTRNPSSFSMFDSEHKTQDSETVDLTNTDEKKKKLAKRLVDMTTKIEELSNQIYHLQQRIEVLEKKNQVSQSDQGTSQT